jgi:hypothetical protein
MTDELRCKHCKREFRNPQGVAKHEPQCRKRLPWVYRVAHFFARRKIEDLAFDRRTHEGRIYEYAVLRFHVDRMEFWWALLVLVGRLYLALPLAEWTGFALIGSGSIELHPLDLLLLPYTGYELFSRRDLIRDYKRHVVDRVDKIAKRA